MKREKDAAGKFQDVEKPVIFFDAFDKLFGNPTRPYMETLKANQIELETWRKDWKSKLAQEEKERELAL